MKVRYVCVRIRIQEGDLTKIRSQEGRSLKSHGSGRKNPEKSGIAYWTKSGIIKVATSRTRNESSLSQE